MLLYRFDAYRLDPRSRRLTRDGTDIAIEPRVLDVVVYLVEHRERAIGRDELIAAVWGRVDSSDATLAQAVLKARRLFGDDGSVQHTIRTVARFGYQWVAATQAGELPASIANTAASDTVAEAPASPALEPVAKAPATSAKPERISPARTKWRPLAAAAIAITFAFALLLAAGHRATRTQAAGAGVAANLILVAPATVHSAVAEDGWMRLGIMAMSAEALRALPGREVVANDTALAAAGAGASDAATLRAKSGAATIVTIDARRDRERWFMEAVLDRADGSRESVEASADDAIAAAGALAARIRASFAPNERSATASPERLALAARMQGTILEGHAERALALADAAPPALAAEPDIVLLRARALNRVGRAAEATAALEGLIARAGEPAPSWLPLAWSTLGYSALVEGAPEKAEQHFRRALAASGSDRNEIGRAWRGIGNAQAARGALDDAEASYLRARFELGGGGDRLLLAHLLDDLGTVAGRRGRFDEAADRYREAAAAAAALGATEIELGARMNVALAESERLHAHAALAAWRDVLPRVSALDYPSMRRYAGVHYADALAETGALRDAAGALDASEDATRDALEDVAIDRLRVRLEIGDARATGVEAQAFPARSSRTADALLLEAALAANDEATAQAIADRLAKAQAGDAPSIAATLALWWRHRGDDARADAAAMSALDAARAQGSPRELRDAAVALATARLARGDVDGARTLAALVEPYAGDDFPIALLLARVDAAAGESAAARRGYDAAKALAGERWTASLSAEASGGPSVAAPRITAAGVR
jgi:DNA-binding winged helix-turn-helix (wHTH) protein